jgi:lipopolysaccharide heptosyltransferase II
MINKIWVINKDMWKKLSCIRSSLHELRVFRKELREERYDIVVDLQGLLRSGIIALATGSPLRVGFQEAREGSRLFYTHIVEGGKDVHAVDRYLKIACFMGCDTSDILFPFPLCCYPSLPLPSTGDYAVVVPGARKPANRWPANRFGELSSLLPIKTLVIGSREDIHLANMVVETSKGNAVSLAGKTDLKNLIGVIKGARFVVSNDSGPMHIAAALGIPVFALFGPANPVRTGPYGKGHKVIREEVPCAPCYRRTCHDLRCMEKLSVEKVFEAIKEHQQLLR